MSRILLTVAIDDAAVGAQGAKEAVAMVLEPLGGVRVLEVQEWSGQMSLLEPRVYHKEGSLKNVGKNYSVRG